MESFEKKPKDILTNERLQRRFTSLFDLVNYAIDVAENMILTGREPNTHTGVQNRAVQVLDEIAKHKETFAEMGEEKEEESPYRSTRESIVQKAGLARSSTKPVEVKPVEVKPVEVKPIEGGVNPVLVD